jgi:hypothetical protein
MIAHQRRAIAAQVLAELASVYGTRPSSGALEPPAPSAVAGGAAADLLSPSRTYNLHQGWASGPPLH